MHDHLKRAVDWLSVGVSVSSVVGLFPAIAALASFIWTCIRIYETHTVQNWIKNRKGGNDK